VLLPVTFLGAILIGAIVLDLPGMSSERVGALEAFFTSASAVCVTGLAVVDTGRDFTHGGQAVIMVLIQLGGLGMMTFSILALVLVGRRVGLDHEQAVRETFTAVASWNIGRLLATVLGVTVLVEGVGFLLLTAALHDPWSALFHAISAFCNAGFSLYSNSLQGRGPAVVLPVMILIILGGLGFTTLLELGKNLRPRRHGGRRFSLHARLVLTTTLVLLGSGTIVLTLTESGDLANAFFMSTSARTAGFDTVPVGSLTGASLLVLIPLMFIGASPGSTGGGIKTTTLAVAALAARATINGREYIVIHGREIPRQLVRRMFAILACGASVVFLAIFFLFLFEGSRKEGILGLVFEAVSAFGTVGLSTGITPDLVPASKILLCVVMFIGRIGSLSLFIFLVREETPSRVRYPEERVLIG